MQRIALPRLAKPLQKRYCNLVYSHLHAPPELAAGVANLFGPTSALAATQATWRFLSHEQVTLPKLVEPLRDVGRSRCAGTQAAFALLVHDWCKMAYRHRNKLDLVQLTHKDDVGYEWTSALLVSADDGMPLAPMEMHVKTANGVLSTRRPAPRDVPHLEQVLPTMNASRSWGLSKPLLHVIDREADSVDHFRQWDAKGHYFLVRADDRRVQWGGKTRLLSAIAHDLQRQHHLRHVGTAAYRGRPAQLWVAETEVVLHRPAKKSLRGRKFVKPGRPLGLRFLVVQVRDDQGNVLAQWMLLSNMPMALAATEHLARCYYWRWNIESFFKLLKGHGQQLEHWQQESGRTIAARLLVASMACVVVWQLMANDSPEAMEFKNVLVRLSGRQTKRQRPHTAPALLAGLWVYLSMLSLLEHYDLRQLKRFAKHIPFFDTG